MSEDKTTRHPEREEAPGQQLFDITARTGQLEYELLERIFGIDALLEGVQNSELASFALTGLSPEERDTYREQADEIEGEISRGAKFAHILRAQPNYRISMARRRLTQLAAETVSQEGLDGFRVAQIDPGIIQFTRQVPYEYEGFGGSVAVDATQTITLQAEGEDVSSSTKTVYDPGWSEDSAGVEAKDYPPPDDIDTGVVIERVNEFNEFLERLKHRDADELRTELEKGL